MLNNMTLAKKLILGFALILVLLIVVGGVGYNALETAGKGFSSYRSLAKQTNLSGRVQANMLMVRMNVKDFIITGSATVFRLSDQNDRVSGSSAQVDRRSRSG